MRDIACVCACVCTCIYVQCMCTCVRMSGIECISLGNSFFSALALGDSDKFHAYLALQATCTVVHCTTCSVHVCGCVINQ